MVKVTRRAFLKVFLGTGAVVVLGALAWRARFQTHLTRLIESTQPTLDPQAPRGMLNEGQLATIVALAETLLPPDTSPGAEAGWVRDHVNARTRHGAGYLVVYREAVVLLDQLAKDDEAVAPQRFQDLSLAQRDILLARYFGRSGGIETLRARLHAMTDAGRVKARVWTFVIKDLISSFYSSATGWAVVGYTHFPGNPGDPREYAAPPSAVQLRISA